MRPTHCALWIVATFVLALDPARALGQGGTDPCRPIRGPLPVVISEEGTYCLTSSLDTTMRQGIAIRITANNVVLDLNGFILHGLADRETTTATGVFAGSPQNITVRNGTIRGFYEGVSMVAQNVTVEHVRADRNTFVGIGVSGAGTVIRKNHVIETGGTTIAPNLGPGAAILASGPSPRVLDNDVTGFPGTPSSRVTGILFIGGGGVAVNNRLVSVARGIEFGGFVPSNGTYRDNLTFDVATPYTGGIDAGNNR